MKHSKLLLTSLLIAISIVLSAQTDFRMGYIIDLNQDTLYGEIDFRSEVRNSRICEFREGPDAEAQRFNPGEISGYRFLPGKYYVSKTIILGGDSLVVFAEYLVKGMADLYFYRDENNDLYFVEKVDGESLILSNEEKEIYVEGSRHIQSSNQYIRLLKATFSDCMEIQPEIDAARLNHRSLISITSGYHDYVCDGEQCIIYEKETSGTKVALIISTGYSSNRLRIKGDELFESFAFNNSNSPVFGLAIDLSSYRLRDNLSFLVGAEFSRNNYNCLYDQTYIYWSWVNHYDVQLTANSLYLYAGPMYRFSSGKVRPRLSAGPAFQKFLNRYFRYDLETEFDNHSVYDSVEEDVVNNWLFGAYIQVGIETDLGKNMVLFADIRGGFMISNPNNLAGLVNLKVVQYRLRSEVIPGVLSVGIKF